MQATPQPLIIDEMPAQEPVVIDEMPQEQTPLAIDEMPQVEPVPVPTPGPDAPPQGTPEVLPAEEPQGTFYNRLTETIQDAAGAALAPVFKGITKVADTVTGTTQQDKNVEAALTDQIPTQVHLVPGQPDKGMAVVPSWAIRIENNEKIRALESEKRELTPKQRATLEELKVREAAYAKAAQMPRPPKTPNSNGGMTANITDEEVAAIATQFKTDPGFLLSHLSNEGLKLESTPAQEAAGEGGSTWAGAIAGLLDASTFGIGKFANRVAASDNDRRALEALRKVAGARLGAARTIAEIATGIVPGIALSKGMAVGAAKVAASPTVQNLLKLSPAATTDLLQKAAVGAEIIGSGATFGVTQADKGKAVEGALQGALMTSPFLGIGPAVKGATKAASAAGNQLAKLKYAQAVQALPFVYEKAATEAAQNLQPGIAKLVSDAQAGVAGPEAYALAQRTGMAVNPQVTPADINKHLFDAQSGVFSKAPGQAEQTYRHLLEQNAFDKEVGKRLQGFGLSYIGRALDTFSAAPWVAAIYDARHGTNGMQLIDTMASDVRSSMVIADKYAKQFSDGVIAPIRQLKKTHPAFRGKSDEETLATVYTMIDSGNVPAELQPIAKNVADFFEDIRVMANSVKTKSGMPVVNIQQLKGGERAYVPHAVKRGMDRVVALEQAAGEELTAKMLTAGPSDEIAGVPNFRQRVDSTGLSEVLGLLEGKPATTMSDKEIVAAFQRHTSATKAGSSAADSPALLAALEQRIGKLPDWFRERNLAKVTGNYLDDVLSQVFVEPHLREAEQIRALMQKAGGKGDPNAVRFWDDWIRQNRFGGSEAPALGIFGSMGAITSTGFNKVAGWAKTKAIAAEAAGKPSKANAWRMVAESPHEAVNYMRHNMYSTFLGGSNIKATVENMVQPLTMGIPQLGTAYGTSVAARSLSRKLPASSRIGTVAALTYESSQEMQQLLKGQLQKQGIVGKAAERASTLGLMLFNATEKFSRQWAYKMGVTVAEDLLAGKPSARDFVKRMPGSYGRNLDRLVAAGDVDGVERMMTDYMTSRISLNYSKESQSAFARSLGPFLNSFSRWPAETVGMVNQAVRGAAYGDSKIKHAVAGAAGSHTQMLAAMLLSEKIYEGMQDYEDATKESRAYNLITGGRGITRFNTMTTIPEMVSSGAGKYSSPIFETLGKSVAGVKDVVADPEDAEAWIRLHRAADSGAALMAPGMWMFKLADTYEKYADDDMERKAQGPIEKYFNQ